MQLRFRRSVFRYLAELMFVLWTLLPSWSAGADKLVGLYSAHAVPYAMPWVADEMGLFKKYDLDFEFSTYHLLQPQRRHCSAATPKWGC